LDTLNAFILLGSREMKMHHSQWPVWTGLFAALLAAAPTHAASTVIRKVLDPSAVAAIKCLENGELTVSNGSLAHWNGYGDGYKHDQEGHSTASGSVRCVNSATNERKGISQSIEFPKPSLAPIVVSGWSKSENVSGTPDSNYSVYVDLVHSDGTPLWGQAASFSIGTHDWQYREVIIVPQKPVTRLTVYGLFRHHTGTVWFDDFSAKHLNAPQGATLFDGALVTTMPPSKDVSAKIHQGQIVVRDAAANSDFFTIGVATETPQTHVVQGLQIEVKSERRRVSNAAHQLEIEIVDQTGKDRAINLYYMLSLNAIGWDWWDNIQERRTIEPDQDYGHMSRSGVGATGYQSLYPFSCVSNDQRALSFLTTEPSICRTSYDARQQCYYTAFYLGLSQETKQPGRARVTLTVADVDPRWSMRATAQLYYELLPQYFDEDRVSKKQGNWMAFSKISEVERPEDFHFAVHEGDSDVRWDNDHQIQSFVYVEPMTFWMSMPSEDERTYAGAMKRFQTHLNAGRSAYSERAWTVKLSGLKDEDGHYSLSIRDTPWCDGAVFANCADPDVPEDGQHLNQYRLNVKRLQEALDRAETHGGLTGVYLDSLEGWGFLQNWRREHWKAADFPLTYDTKSKTPTLLNIMSTYEFTARMAEWMRGQDKLLMANSVPHRYPWLANPLDLLGTETNWLRDGQFVPPSADYMFLKRTMAWHKPYMFLMNTHYDDFGPEFVERYMQRCLFYGMFPGFFSEDASTNPYFEHPKWYNRDRHLFRKYLPVIKKVAEAGWEPITLGRSSDSAIWLERFGQSKETGLYMTVMNSSDEAKQATIKLQQNEFNCDFVIDVLSDKRFLLSQLQLSLKPEEVRVLRLEQSSK
jgi:hypothetical protein